MIKIPISDRSLGVVAVARQIAACFGVDVEPIGEVDE